ncbi:hypothetical protein MTR62_04970 [Novosphingobium sp. 1949]|uniref:Uncharacterized protein n=1 Tax=Novosphingobium organovorum TaxID=2930092 RepID=A0ABT0BAI0_9SPHN|nr:hypothetical protein [Novosphingobium organovorum]MCJ2182057.1 hypothetical protein [Novosphingobium organovorum]
MKSPNSIASDANPINGLMPVDAVADLIRAGATLSLAGRKAALDRLPAGAWIAGTSPYFMTAEGGRVVDDDVLFVTDLGSIGPVSFATYDANELDRISGDAPDSGVALAVIPSGSICHSEFAKNAASYPMAFLRPTVGWISGYDLSQDGECAWAYDGQVATAYNDRVAVAHITLPEGTNPIIEIVNIFSADGGDVIRFEETGFTPGTCLVNGERRVFSDYIVERGREGGDLPLVGDFGGARVNASIKNVDVNARTVELYAPVFPGVDYSFAAPVADYAADFREALADHPFDGAVWSCNCILNFLFGQLEGVAIGGVAGPVTFGEVAYQLLNQTMVVIRKD